MRSLSGKCDHPLDPVERQKGVHFRDDLLRGLVLGVDEQVLDGNARPFQAPASGYRVGAALDVGAAGPVDAIGFDPTTPDWRMWLKAAGVEGVDPARGPRFSNSDHAIQAAVDGAGVALGRTTLATADVAAGRLVLPFELSLPMRPAYYLVLPKAAKRSRKVAAFRDWILAEAAAERAG